MTSPFLERWRYHAAVGPPHSEDGGMFKEHRSEGLKKGPAITKPSGERDPGSRDDPAVKRGVVSTRAGRPVTSSDGGD